MEDAAQILTAIAAQMERAKEMSNVAQELAGELAKLRGVGASDDREVVVTVDHQGIVLDIRVNDEALAAGGERIAAMVMTATSRAIEDVQAQAAPLQAAILQPDLPPMRTDLGDKLDELYDLAQEIDARTRRADGAAPSEEGRS